MQHHRFTIVLVGLIAACEQRSPRDDQKTTPTDPTGQPSPDPSPAARKAATGSGSNGGGLTGSGSAAAGSAAGSGANAIATTDTVRKPVAADLADYTKDIPGKGQKLMMTMETSQGTLHCEMWGDKAPMTVANFVGLATGKKPWLNPKTNNVEKGKPYFNGLTFHRVIPGFMIQGGDPTGSGMGGPGYSFGNEFEHIGATDDMGPGTLAMANAGDGPDGGGTNGSQFFVMEATRGDLVRKHTMFGKCNELDVVKKITGVPRDDNDKPNTPVTINKVTFEKK